MNCGESTRKRISLGQLKPGMYVVALDRAWIHTPFLFHSKQIKNVRDIELFAKYGIREVVIDTQLGGDEEVVDALREPALEKHENTLPGAATVARFQHNDVLQPLLR